MAQNVKTVLGVAIANVKTFCGVPIANCKTILGVDNTGGGPSGIPAVVTVDGLADLRNDLDGIGMRIQPQVDVTITALGMWKNSGITGTKTARVYAADGTTVLASTSIDLTGQPDEAFVYAVLGTPLSVPQFDVVLIFVDVTNGVDSVYLQNTITPEADILVANSIFRQGGGINNFQGADHDGGPVDFYFTAP